MDQESKTLLLAKWRVEAAARLRQEAASEALIAAQKAGVIGSQKEWQREAYTQTDQHNVLIQIAGR